MVAEAEPTERWLPVAGWEGYYEVSDLGRVRGVPRVVSDGRPGGRRVRGRVLKQFLSDGYLAVILCRDGRPKMRKAHQLVAAAFIGPCPEGQEVRHGPAGKLDNQPGNLCYGTRAQNMADCVRDGTDGRGERNWNARLTWAKVAEIHQRVAQGETQVSLAAEYGVSFGTISKIVRGETWGRP